MSTGSSLTSIFICPAACTPSVWNMTPCARQTSPRARTGCIVPISLFAAIIVASIVSGRIAFSSSSGDTMPRPSTGSIVYSKPILPSHLTVSRIAWCSIALVIMWFPLPRSRSAHAAPLIARLSASLPAPVKIISVGSAFISAATFARAASTASRASRPSLCRLFGLP